MPGAKNWVFTLNNYDSEIDVAINNYFSGSDGLVYIVYQREVGESGTPHLQGYASFDRRRTLASVRTFLDTAHWEIMRGTPAEARAYCTKLESRAEGSEPTELGQLPGPSGRRSDLMEVKATIDSGSTMRETWDLHFGAMVRYHRSFTEYKRIKAPQRDWKTQVTLIVGPTGTGKSRYANGLDTPENTYFKQNSQWWDGYDGQPTVVLDDFYGWIALNEMLRLMDRYPMMVQTKGGQTTFAARSLLITSNALPSHWYSKIFSEQRSAAPSFYRRIDTWLYMGTFGAFKARSQEEFEEKSAKFVLLLE